MKHPAICLLLPAMVLLAGCLQISTDKPIEVAPIHITVDVTVRVEKALDDFFGKAPTAGAR
jgi:hypothetical protein